MSCCLCVRFSIAKDLAKRWTDMVLHGSIFGEGNTNLLKVITPRKNYSPSTHTSPNFVKLKLNIGGFTPPLPLPQLSLETYKGVADSIRCWKCVCYACKNLS